MAQSGVFIRGMVGDIERNGGEFDAVDRVTGAVTRREWVNWTVAVGGHIVKVKSTPEGTPRVELPAEGDVVEIGFTMELKLQEHNVLQPYALVMVANSVEVVETAADAQARREARAEDAPKVRRPRAVAAV